MCSGHSVPVKEKHPAYSSPLSLEQSKCCPLLAVAALAEMRLLLKAHLLLFNAGKVFVTYEADNDKHVNEIIKFVALLRHNGFDTHVRTGFCFYCFSTEQGSARWTSACLFQIDIFEQQFRSISKIDFMERYLSEVRATCSYLASFFLQAQACFIQQFNCTIRMKIAQ